ncbi:hypothetical protein J4G08_02825 [Candidatus Poribacteria bacterium]|nr:hypothetical protein [Candidatus Poribacteria bacterium]
MRYTLNFRRCILGLCLSLLGLSVLVFFGNFISDVESDENQHKEMYQAFKDGKCKSCHPAIWREWEKSIHAQAWVDEIYQEAAKQVAGREKSCDPCHAPKPILVTGIGKMPKLRNVQRDSGVSCLVCHLDSDGAMQGPPASAETNFHANVTNPIYKESTKLCATCHGQPSVPEHDQVSSFLKSKFATENKSCATCHMPLVSRLQSTASYESITGRKHTWRGSRSVTQLKNAAALKIEFADKKATVTLQNKAGHLLPGGTLRIIVLDVMHLAPNGTQNQKKQVLISEKRRNRLKPDEKRTFDFKVNSGDTLKVRLRYQLTPKTSEPEWILMAEESKIAP